MKIIKSLATFIIAALVLSPIKLYAQDMPQPTSEEYIDRFLASVGTPTDVLENMDEELKQLIYETSEHDMKYVETTLDPSLPQTYSSGYQISSSNLAVGVTAYKTSSGLLKVYPSYEWKVPVQPKGKDYFAYSTHDDYSVIPNQRSNNIYTKISKTDPWKSSGSVSYTGTHLTGYEHRGTSLGSPNQKLYIKANFYYQVSIDASNPVNKIVITYVHDTSSGGSYSYGVGYGPLSISVTPSSSNVGYHTNAYWLNY